jgi:hypothetical protein
MSLANGANVGMLSFRYLLNTATALSGAILVILATLVLNKLDTIESKMSMLEVGQARMLERLDITIARVNRIEERVLRVPPLGDTPPEGVDR